MLHPNVEIEMIVEYGSRIESRRELFRTRLVVVLVLRVEMSLCSEIAFMHCCIASALFSCMHFYPGTMCCVCVLGHGFWGIVVD